MLDPAEQKKLKWQDEVATIRHIYILGLVIILALAGITGYMTICLRLAGDKINRLQDAVERSSHPKGAIYAPPKSMNTPES